MKALAKALQQPSVACLLISLLVLTAILGVRARGWLQRPELIVYDLLIRQGSLPKSTDDRLAIVGMTEDDLKNYIYPIDDARLARVLEGIAAQEPCVIGLDMYRDVPEPRTGEQYPQLEATLKRHAHIITIERVGYANAPPALKGVLDRVTPNNLEKDEQIDGSFRRGPLICEKGLERPRESFSFVLAASFLAEKNVAIDMLDGPAGSRPLVRLGSTVFPRLTRDAGGYVGLDVHDYEYLIDFRAPRTHRIQDARDQLGRDSPHDYSFADVIEGRLPPGALKGRIVLVATVMYSQKDYNPTPIADVLRGVQQHAMMVNQLLRAALDGEPPIGWWPEWAEVAWIALWTLAGGALGLGFRSPWKLAPALLLLLGALGLAGWQMFEHRTWILMAAPALGCFVSATFVTSFIAYLERSERGQMQQLFSKHVSSDVVEALWAQRDQFLDGGRMKPQRLTATVLFTDLKGFSTTSEKMDPATLMNWMNEYMNGVARHVDEHNGIINKFIGDAIMALFGVPLAHTKEEEIDQDAVNAVECALHMRAEIAKLNADWTARGLPTTAMRVGIYTGPLVAGSMGSEERLEFTVLGDTVNTAARLEGAGKEAADDPRTAMCTILIGDSTFQRLRGNFETQPIGAMTLKGKADKIMVHSVIAAAGKTPHL